MKLRHVFLLAFLLAALPAFGQLVLVGGCAASATSCTPATVGGHTFASGQFIYTFAFRTATTAPTLSSSPTFTGLDTASASSSSFRSGCAVSTSGSPSSGTWANATRVVTLIYSGSPATSTANCASSGVGGKTASGTSGTTSTITYTGITLTHGDGSSWVIGAAGGSAAVCTPATVLHAEESSTDLVGNDTNGGVTSFSTLTCTGSTGNWKSDTVELLSTTLAAPTFTPDAGGFTTVGGVYVTINLPGGATGCYTTDNSTPTGSPDGTCSHGSTYSAPVLISTSGTVLQAIATESGFVNSAVKNSTYTLTTPFSMLSLMGAGIGGFALIPPNTFYESWGGGSESCGFGGASSCNQFWNLASGTNATVTSCPAGGTVPATNCLKLAHNATQTSLQSYGTMPLIPQSTGAVSTLTFSFYYTSATLQAFNTALVLQVVASGAQAYQTVSNSSGSGQWYWNDGNTAETVSTNTWHYITVVINGASSYSSLDGGTHQTFTAPAHDYDEIILNSDTNSSDFYYGPITITTTYDGGWPPSSISDWAGGSGTPTATNLAAGTHCGNGVWGESGSTLTFTFDNTTSIPFPGNHSACGTSYGGNTGVSLKAAWTPTSSSDSWGIGINTTYSNLYWGVYWRTNVSDFTNLTFTDQGGSSGSVGSDSTAWHICGSTSTTQCIGATPYTYLLICNENGAGTTIGCAQITNATWYWITGENLSTGADYLNVYNVNQTTGAVGSLVASFGPAGNPDNAPGAMQVRLGDVGGEAPGASMSSWYENLIITYADGSFPVLP